MRSVYGFPSFAFVAASILSWFTLVGYAQQFITSEKPSGVFVNPNDDVSCGGAFMTQNTNHHTIVDGTVACGITGGPTVENSYARSYQITAATTIKCVDFAVETNIGGDWPVRVRLYQDTNGGAPDVANLVQLGGDVNITIPGGASSTFVSAVFPGGGVAVPANSTLVVELFQACRNPVSSAGCPPGGDGGQLYLGSNNLGQSAATYIKAPECGLNDFVDLATVGFPSVHILQALGSGLSVCELPLPPCRSDIAGPGGGGPDGTTNVVDLLACINTWGQNGQPSGPRPQGDCAPLPNGDCFVNVADMLAIINGWGPCPEPTGACCLPNGTCAVNQTVNQCINLGGVYQGHGIPCPNGGCPVLPPNDECGGALPIFNGVTPIDNSAATTSVNIPGAACIFGGFVNFRKDLWYSYTATCTGMVTVHTCATTGAVTDTVLSVFTGPCTALDEVGCDDDSCSGNVNGDRSVVTFLATAGVEYKIRVGTFGTNAGGPMVLTISCGPAPPQGLVNIKQLHWGGAVGQGIQIFYSRVGEAVWNFDPTNPIHPQLLLANGGGYINLALATTEDGGDGLDWVVQNLYLAYPNLNYLEAARPSVQFALPVNQGQPAIQAFCMMSITPFPLNQPQPQFQFADVISHPVYHAGGRNNGGTDLSIIPIIIGPWTGPILLPVDWAFIDITFDEIVEIDENTNHCAPASCARSLKYLNAPGDGQDICDDLADLMDTTKEEGTADEDMESGKETFTEGHNLGINTHRTYGPGSLQEAMDALAAGCDVEALIGWSGGGGHAAMVTGMVKWPDGSYTITYVDDPTQGDDTAENQEHTIHVDADGDFDGGTVDGFMIECYD